MKTQSPLLDAFRLDEAVAVITGGARGIGLETAKLFGAAGAEVVLLDRDQEMLDKASAALGPWGSAIRTDVTSEANVESAFDEIIRIHGHIDICVNNAGTAIRKASVELTLEDWRTVVDVNMTGVFLTARTAARQMLKQGAGRIVNLASIFGLSGGGLYPNISYQATKGAVVNMTRAFAMEWASAGIRVNAVAPTWVDTEFIAALKAQPDLVAQINKITPMGRMATSLEVAYAILYLASPASAMVTGHVLAVDGGFLAQ